MTLNDADLWANLTKLDRLTMIRSRRSWRLPSILALSGVIAMLRRVDAERTSVMRAGVIEGSEYLRRDLWIESDFD